MRSLYYNLIWILFFVGLSGVFFAFVLDSWYSNRYLNGVGQYPLAQIWGICSGILASIAILILASEDSEQSEPSEFSESLRERVGA